MIYPQHYPSSRYRVFLFSLTEMVLRIAIFVFNLSVLKIRWSLNIQGARYGVLKIFFLYTDWNFRYNENAPKHHQIFGTGQFAHKDFNSEVHFGKDLCVDNAMENWWRQLGSENMTVPSVLYIILAFVVKSFTISRKVFIAKVYILKYAQQTASSFALSWNFRFPCKNDNDLRCPKLEVIIALRRDTRCVISYPCLCLRYKTFAWIFLEKKRIIFSVTALAWINRDNRFGAGISLPIAQ